MALTSVALRLSVSLAFAPIALALPQKTPDVRLDSGDAPGASFSETHRMAAEGDSIFAVWNDYRNGFDSDIYFNRSLDAGRRWLPTDVRIDTVRAAGASGSLGPEIASQGSSV